MIKIYLTIPRFLTLINCAALWLCYLPVAFLVHIFSETSDTKNPDKPEFSETSIPSSIPLPSIPSHIANILLMIGFPFVGSVLFGLVLIFGSFGFTDGLIIGYGRSLGTLASVVTFIQYLPQIYTTYKLKSSGSLSMIMLSIQCPGGYFNCLFMAFGQKNDWSIWLPYFVAATQQLILLLMCIYFKCCQKRKLLADEETSNTIRESPLLKGNDGKMNYTF